MKKIVTLIAVIFILASSGCKRNNESSKPSGTTASSASQTTAPPPTEVISTLPDEPVTLPPENYDNPIVMTAEGLIGIEFAENGASPAEGFDNSGFIYYVMRENGYINCPRRLSEQAKWGHNAEYDEIRAGDIVFFSEEKGGDVSFGGIYAGGGIMIYSPYPGEKVKKADITTDYYKSRFVTAVSL